MPINIFNKKDIEPTLFWPAVIVIAIISVPLTLYPQVSEKLVSVLLNWLTQRFGWIYLTTGITSFVLMCWLAYGPLGKIKLGAKEDKPEFGNISWIAMLFCGGIGISICNWAFVEPLYMLITPPLHITKDTTEAIEWAAMYPMFHWGFIPWSIYLLPALPIGYALYVRKTNVLRLSEACRGLLKQHTDGYLGKIIDLVVIFSIVGAVGTSLGLSVPLVTTLSSHVLGLEDSLLLKISILFIFSAMIGWSVYNGLSNGIQVLSNINLAFAVFVLVFTLLVAPSIFIFKLWTNSIGLFLDNFFRINFWTDPVEQKGFPETWTIFYWAWWIAYSPMMGLFVARISKGRTIKEIILHGVAWGTLGCCTFFAIWGGYSLYLQTHLHMDLVGILQNQGIPQTVVAVLETLPFSKIVFPLFAVLCIIFLVTTVDSSVYMLASICTRHLNGYQEPGIFNRIVWTLIVTLLGIALVTIGGLEAVKISTVIVALPMIPVLGIMTYTLVKWAYADFGSQLREGVIARSDPDILLKTQTNESDTPEVYNKQSTI